MAPVTDDELRESDSNRNAIRRLNILWSVMAGAKKPNEQHYRDAAKQLNASGDPITPAAVKKLWQREGEIYLHMRKWQGRS